MVAVVMICAPPMYDVLATYNDPCIPTPPATCSAPVVVDMALVVLAMSWLPEVHPI